MVRGTQMLSVLLTAVISVATAAAQSSLTAAQIADRNVAARGGLQSWRSVQALAMSGKMEAGGNNRPAIAAPGVKSPNTIPNARLAEQVRLPFVLEQKRPRKTRLEIQFKGQTAVQIFDGTNGWKLRPFLNRSEVEPFTPDEMKMAALATDLDGPLVDYAAKGTKVELQGMEKIADRNNYKLELTSSSGHMTHVWIDATTFLETKMDGNPRRMDGAMHPVEIYYHDYRSVGALKIPYLLETKVLNVATSVNARQTTTVTEQIVLDKVEVNPKLDDAMFTKAQLETKASPKPASTAKLAQP